MTYIPPTQPVDTLTQWGPSLTSMESEYLRRSPEAIQLIIDHLDLNIAEADAMGEECKKLVEVLQARRGVLIGWRDELLRHRGDEPGDMFIVDLNTYK